MKQINKLNNFPTKMYFLYFNLQFLHRTEFVFTVVTNVAKAKNMILQLAELKKVPQRNSGAVSRAKAL